MDTYHTHWQYNSVETIASRYPLQTATSPLQRMKLVMNLKLFNKNNPMLFDVPIFLFVQIENTSFFVTVPERLRYSSLRTKVKCMYRITLGHPIQSYLRSSSSSSPPPPPHTHHCGHHNHHPLLALTRLHLPHPFIGLLGKQQEHETGAISWWMWP